MQISFAETAKLISAFVFATWIVQSSYILNFKPLAIYCDCTAPFVLDLVGNPEDRFSHNEAQISIRNSIFDGKLSITETEQIAIQNTVSSIYRSVFVYC